MIPHQTSRPSWPWLVSILGGLGLALLSPPADAHEALRFATPGTPSVTLTGQLKLDAMLDGSQTYSDLPAFAQPTSALDSNGILQPNAAAVHQSMNLGVRETFLQLSVTHPLQDKWQAMALIDVGFLGFLSAGVDAGSPTPVLRSAYAHLSGESPWSLDFGQLQGPFSPLDPPTLNGNLAAYSGNLLSRLPQVRVGYEAGPMTLALAAVRPADLAADTRGAGFDLVGRGQDSGRPEVQGRFEWRLGPTPERFGGRPIPNGVALSGRYAQEAILAGTTSERRFTSWGVALDGRAAFFDCLYLETELYRGHDLDNVYGLSGVTGMVTSGAFTAHTAVPETGGWASLGLSILEGLDVHLLYGLAAPDDASFGKPGWRQDSGLDVMRNETMAFNILWRLLPSTVLGCEIARLNTHYVPLDRGGTKTNGTLDRLQFSFIQGF